MEIIVITGGNDSGKTLSTKLLIEKSEKQQILKANFREGLTVYQNFSILIYGIIDHEFVKHLNFIKPDILLDKSKNFYSEHVSFGFYLKTIVSQIYELNFAVLLAETDEDKKIRNELKLRDKLFDFGEHAKIYDQQVWAKALFELINKLDFSKKQTDENLQKIIINDLRFIPELDYLANLDKTHKKIKMINLIRKNIRNTDEIVERAKTYPNIEMYYVENNGTVEELLEKLEAIV